MTTGDVRRWAMVRTAVLPCAVMAGACAPAGATIAAETTKAIVTRRTRRGSAELVISHSR